MQRRIAVVLAVSVLMTLGLTAVAAADPSNPAVRRDKEWHLRDSLTSGPATTTYSYGTVGDTPLMCDWNGDGSRTPAVLRVQNGRWQWHIRNAHAGGQADETFVYGLETDWPVCGDWDADGSQTPGVVRERDDHRFVWHLRNALAGGAADHTFVYGRNFNPGVEIPTFPLTGDWNGNGQDTPGLAEGREDGRFEWHLRNALAGGAADINFVYYGGAVWGDHLEVHTPVIGDWNDDGNDTVGVVRGRGEKYRWLLRNAHAGGNADVSFVYGRHLDFPQVWE